MVGPAFAGEYSLRFFGNGASAPGLDRVAIPLDDPARPVDIGVGDFTVEWWMKADLSENPSGQCVPGRDNWIFGNIILDRDVFAAGDWGDWGVSLAGGFIAFGVDNGSWGAGICGETMVANGEWHHVAVSRQASDGGLRIYVDGFLDGEVTDGPMGDVSYRDGRSTAFAWDPYLVIGAEKHDAGPLYPSYSGWIDELRLSTILRYEGSFDPPGLPFRTDASTAALYHFDEGGGAAILDSSGTTGGPSNGEVRFGGNPSGPLWTTDTPFAGAAIFLDGFESGDTRAWFPAEP